MENMVARTLFLLDILRVLEVHPVRDCRVPDPGLMRSACTDGEDRFGAQQPRDRFEPREPGAAQTRAWGAGSLERRPARVLATPGTDGSRNRRAPRVTRGRQPERACSGPSG